eukprot:scaffold246_cov242-Pinguiococcus_pyrenoidosus.AAC.24
MRSAGFSFSQATFRVSRVSREPREPAESSEPLFNGATWIPVRRRALLADDLSVDPERCASTPADAVLVMVCIRLE